MADSFDFFFSPTGPSWLPDRSPKGARRGRDGEVDPRAATPVFRNARSWRAAEPQPARDESGLDAESARRLEPHGVEGPPAAPQPARPAPLSTGQAAALLRDVAAPTLRAVVSRLLARGHEVSLRDALDSADPRLVVLFLPTEGPLRPIGAADPSLACFEIRIERDRETGTDAAPAGAHVVARHSSGPGRGGFLTLGRTSATGLAPAWITDRFVEFVQLTLERALDTT